MPAPAKLRILLTEQARSGDVVMVSVIVGDRRAGTISTRSSEWDAVKRGKVEVIVGVPMPLVAGNTRT
jgi:hypothetical protein